MRGPGEGRQSLLSTRWWLVLGAIGVLAVGAAGWGLARGEELDLAGLAETLRSSVLVGLQQIPLPLYLLAFALLPAFGFPITPFYLTVAVMMGGLWPGLLAAWVCVALDLAFAYWLAAGLARPWVSRLVERRGYRIPHATAGNARRLTLLVRLSPLPLVMQNCILGLAQVPFPLYIFWSVLVQCALGAGVIFVGESLFQGNARLLLPGLFLLLVVVSAVSWWRRRAPAPIEDGLGT